MGNDFRGFILRFVVCLSIVVLAARMAPERLTNC